MGRLKRFDDHRYIGARPTMEVFDCDDDDQFALLERMVERNDLAGSNQLQTFAPDTLAEAANRGFRPSKRVPSA